MAEQKKEAGTTPPPHEDHGAFRTPVLVRSNFYRDNYRRLMVVTLITGLIAAGLMGAVYWARTHKPVVRYYATTSDGKLPQLFPLSQPNLSTSTLLEWVIEAGTSAYNFDFGNYAKALEDLKKYFTPAGYQNYLAALNQAKTIDTVRAKSLVVFAVPTDPPVILKEGATPDGHYAWQVQMPMLVTYQSASETEKQRIVLTMLIQRLPTLESPKGIGIASIQVRTRTGS